MNKQELQTLRDREAAAARKATEQGDKDALHAALSQVHAAQRAVDELREKSHAAAVEASRAAQEAEISEKAVERAAAALIALIEKHGG
jgi:hypothetical protein